MVFADWQVGEVFWAMLWFSLLFSWIWVVITVFVDVFRSRDLSGWGKALWTLFVIVLPFLGVFSYLIARGDKIGERRLSVTTALVGRRRRHDRYQESRSTHAGVYRPGARWRSRRACRSLRALGRVRGSTGRRRARPRRHPRGARSAACPSAEDGREHRASARGRRRRPRRQRVDPDGTAPDGSEVRQGGRSADVVRRQPDGSWLVLVDKP